MEKVSQEELLNMKRTLEEGKKRSQILEEELNDLTRKTLVAKYISLFDEYKSTLNIIKRLEEEIPYQEMLNCDHYFVITDVEHDFDGHRTDTYNIVTCVKCGLTNRYMNDCCGSYFSFDDSYSKMNEIYKLSGCSVIHGYCDYDELDFYKEEYDKFKECYPNASDDDVENYMALVKKIKGGKLC